MGLLGGPVSLLAITTKHTRVVDQADVDVVPMLEWQAGKGLVGLQPLDLEGTPLASQSALNRGLSAQLAAAASLRPASTSMKQASVESLDPPPYLCCG